MAVVTVLLVALAARTIARNREYATPLSLWRTVVERRPHGRARMSYGTELVNAGQHDEAVSQLRLAVSDFPDARYALGTELIVAGQIDEGARELQEFIRRQPSRPDRIPARLLLGRAFLSQGKLDDAVKEFRNVLDMAASNPLARQGIQDVIAEHLARATAALRDENMEEASRHAREVLRLDAKNVSGHNLLGVALASRGKLDDAIAEFRAALAINPDDPQARNNLTRAMGLQRRRE
jgi:Flp pilus assembly protein TadD